MYVIGHGNNYIAAFITYAAALAAAEDTPNREINEEIVPCSVLKLTKIEYLINDGILNSEKLNISVPLIKARQWKNRKYRKCKQHGCNKMTRSIFQYCSKHLPNSNYR